MFIGDIPTNDLNLEKEIKETIKKEIKEGILKEYDDKYSGISIRFNTTKEISKTHFNLSCFICTKQGKIIRAFDIDDKFNLRLSNTYIGDTNC